MSMMESRKPQHQHQHQQTQTSHKQTGFQYLIILHLVIYTKEAPIITHERTQTPIPSKPNKLEENHNKIKRGFLTGSAAAGSGESNNHQEKRKKKK